MTVILVPIDGSKRAERALDGVIERVRNRPGVHVDVLYVHEPPIRYGRILGMQPQARIDAFREERAAEVLRDAAARLQAAGVPAATHVAHGELYAEIARAATALSASEIVLGVRPPWFARALHAVARRVRPLEALRVPVTYAS